MNSDVLLVMVVGRLFELNHSKSKINDTVLTCRATGFIDMQIHYVFQKDMSVLPFPQVCSIRKTPTFWQVSYNNLHLYQN